MIICTTNALINMTTVLIRTSFSKINAQIKTDLKVHVHESNK